MASNINNHLLDNFRNWSQLQLHEYHSCVAFVETEDHLGNIQIGNCFHIGDGIFITARNVIENKSIKNIGFDSNVLTHESLQKLDHVTENSKRLNIIDGPFYHVDKDVDVGFFRLDFIPTKFIPLSRHIDNYLGHSEFLLHRTLLIGHPPIPYTSKPVLAAAIGDINAIINIFDDKYLHYVVSSTMKLGFCGGQY